MSRDDLVAVGLFCHWCGQHYERDIEPEHVWAFVHYGLCDPCAAEATGLKIDSSQFGAEPGEPVLSPTGMRGEHVQGVSSPLEDLMRFLVERCEEPAR